MRNLRKGIFIAIYNLENKIPEYLILKRSLHWTGWEFPKGGLEKGENQIKCAKREIYEETGLRPLKINSHDFKGEFLYEKELMDRPGIIGQTFSLYSAQVKKSKVKIDKKEHSEFKWVNFKNAIKKIKYQNQKDSLKIVDEFLNKKLIKCKELKLSSGKKISLGKDARNNDKLVRFYEGKENTILHTIKPGSPFCVIEDLSFSKADLKEAAIICAAKSQDYRDNKNDVLVHKFTGKNVKKPKLAKAGTWKVSGKPEVIKVKKEDIKSWQSKNSK